jgi:hypothetical protein
MLDCGMRCDRLLHLLQRRRLRESTTSDTLNRVEAEAAGDGRSAWQLRTQQDPSLA